MYVTMITLITSGKCLELITCGTESVGNKCEGFIIVFLCVLDYSPALTCVWFLSHIQGSTFAAWLEKFKHQVLNYHGENSKVLLLIDGAGCHVIDPARIVEEYEVPTENSGEHSSMRLIKYHGYALHMYILVLPPRTTTSIQPLDQGVILSWKGKTSRHKGFWQVSRHEKGKSASMADANIAQALVWVKRAWEDVSREVSAFWQHLLIIKGSASDICFV